MLVSGLVAAAAAAAAAIAQSKMSSDSAEDQQKYATGHTFDKSSAYDPNAFQYGGAAGQANADASKYNLLGDNAQYRTAQPASYTAANGYADTGNADAGQQRNAAALMMARASGQVPSIAQQQAALQSQQLVAQQSSQAASARGAAGLALASQTAATNTANGQASISGQAQINAGTERLNAEQAASGAYSNLRSGDLGAQQQAAQQSQYNAGLAQQQRAQNDQYQLAQQQNAMAVKNSQLQAGIAQQSLMAGSQSGATSANLAIQQQNAANQQAIVGRTAQTIGQIASTAASVPSSGGAGKADPSASTNSNNMNATASSGQAYAPPRAKGGPVAGGRPYLVGEQGPELMVPKRDGIVIPAGPTAALVGGHAPAHALPFGPTAAMLGLPARAGGGPVQAGGAPDAGVLPLYEPPGQQLHQTPDGHAYLASDPMVAMLPSMAGSTPSGSPAMTTKRPRAAPKAVPRKMTPEELSAEADRQMASMQGTHDARMAQGPAVRRLSGGTPESGYNTELTQGAEQAYRAKFGTNSDADYDLRGASAAGLTDGAKTARAPDGSAYFPDHLPDTYKKPNHETFSNESQYARFAPGQAGAWNGNQFVAPPAAPLTAGGPAPAPAPGQAAPAASPASVQLQQAIASDPAKAAAFQQGIVGILGPQVMAGSSQAELTAQIHQMLVNDPAKAAAVQRLMQGLIGSSGRPQNDSTSPAMYALGGRGPIGAPAMLAARARGGPVSGRMPYLVGEEGPELVMPMMAFRRRTA